MSNVPTICIHFDWNIFENLRGGTLPFIQNFIQECKHMEFIVFPYTLTHVMEALNIKDSQENSREELINRSLTSLGVFSNDQFWIPNPHSRNQHFFTRSPLSFKDFSILEQMTSMFSSLYDRESERKKRKRLHALKFSSHFLNNNETSNIFSKIDQQSLEHEVEEVGELPDLQSMLSELESSSPSMTSDMLKMLDSIGLRGIILEDDLKLFARHHISHFWESASQNGIPSLPGSTIDDIVSYTNDMILESEQFSKSILEKRGVPYLADRSITLFDEISQTYHQLANAGYHSDSIKGKKNLYSSLFFDSKHCAEAIFSSVHLTADENHFFRMQAVYEKFSIPTLIYLVDESNEEEVVHNIKISISNLFESMSNKALEQTSGPLADRTSPHIED